jgi:hypothetical protein
MCFSNIPRDIQFLKCQKNMGTKGDGWQKLQWWSIPPCLLKSIFSVFSKYFRNQISYKNARPLFGKLLTSPLWWCSWIKCNLSNKNFSSLWNHWEQPIAFYFFFVYIFTLANLIFYYPCVSLVTVAPMSTLQPNIPDKTD